MTWYKSALTFNVLKLIVVITITTVLSRFLNSFGVAKESIIMIFLIGVLLVTITTKGYTFSILSSIITVLVFNFFFTQPLHTLTIYSTNDVILMATFLVAALITGSMTKMLQEQIQIAKKNEHTARLLYKVTDSFLNLTEQKNIVLNGIDFIYQNTGYNSHVSLVDSDYVYTDNHQQASDHTDILEIPINGLTKKLGTIEILYNKECYTLEHELLIKTVITQMGLSLDRETMYNERQNIRIAMEKEELRTNLLRAISHDLRTPLTGIVGASGVLIDNINQLDKDNIRELMNDIHEESIWLTNLVENILNMTRIGEGRLLIEKNHDVIDDVVYEAIKHISGLSKNRNISVSLPEEVITLYMDSRLIVQVLVNLFENAIKHTPDHCNIHLRVYLKDIYAYFEVSDNGNGIDEQVKDSLFCSFVSYSHKVIDGRRGMGLGLTICKSIIEAHGGQITAGRAPEGGAMFTFTLPLSEEQHGTHINH